MKILYLSVHGVLEYDELKLFTELGHECCSHGSYINPHVDNAYRPAIPEMKYDPAFAELANRHPASNLHPDMIEDKDVIIVMHMVHFITNNWDKIKHKRVIWRSIGQSEPLQESMLSPYRQQGLQIVRYSPRERQIPNYIGEDAVIRFYKDPSEYCGWTGTSGSVMAMNQAMKYRGLALNYDFFHQACDGLPVKLFGPLNDNVPENAGFLSYDLMKRELRENRVFLYTGTRIASYTLGFIEAFMTGIPIVSVGEVAGNNPTLQQKTFEVPELIEHGVDGFVSDDIAAIRAYILTLLSNYEYAKYVSSNARRKAVQLFGKETIKSQWKNFLEMG